MPPGNVIFVLFSILLGVNLAAKNANSDWQRTNSMSSDEDTLHTDNQHSGIIDIDDEQTFAWDGSGSDQFNDDEDYQPSGDGVEEEGSAAERSMCELLRDNLNGKELIGAYIPRCTPVGEFEPMQCHSSTGECWCVNNRGQQIERSIKKTPERPDCDRFDREGIVVPTRRPPPDNKPPPHGDERDEDEEDDDHDGDIHAPTDNILIDAPVDGVSGGGTKNGDKGVVDISKVDDLDGEDENQPGNEEMSKNLSDKTILGKPGVLAGIIGGAVVGLLCAVLAVMFIVYRMRKKDEGSYALDDNSKRSPSLSYTRANTEYFA